MPAIVYPTSPTVISPAPVPLGVFANNTVGTAATIDLRNSFGMWLYGSVTRTVATALVRPCILKVRPTINGDTQFGSFFDRMSSIAVCGSTTLNGAVTAGATSVVVNSATNIAIGDYISLRSSDSPPQRFEICRVANITSNTLSLDSPLLLDHPNSEICTSGTTVFDRFWIQGGDIWQVGVSNFSGQSVICDVKGIIYSSDTVL